jgi:HSP20 family protein
MKLTPWKSSSTIPVLRTRIDDDFSSFQREMNNLMSSFFSRGDVMFPVGMTSPFVPSMDLNEKDDAYYLDLDVPGMKEEDIDINFHNNVLTVKGESKNENEERGADYICKERSRQSFRRDIAFDENVDQEKIKAEMKAGVLHVELAKKERSKQTHKKIEIKH